ncbi:MAG: formate dehydrogenase accessory protein FdhE [Actinobacteria bacterium]|nr:formate dehydrogenase accessory protein FdhE [Actinomycetota bacterium]
MAIRIETRDPGKAGIRKSVETYTRMYPDYADAIGFYGAVMDVQQQALCEIECAADFSGMDIEGSLRRGSPLLDPAALEIPIRELHGVISGVCSVVEQREAPGFIPCKELLEWDGLAEKGFPETRERLLRGAEYAGKGATDTALLASVIWESMMPFYRKCAAGIQDGIDHSLWQKGRCPICGTGPLMGEFRQEDGLWLLECRLCHTLWNVQRAACPFCSQGLEGSLEYLYLEDYTSYRAYYCRSCGLYVKNVDLHAAQRDAVLPLDNIVSELIGLDRAAEQEGLKPA